MIVSITDHVFSVWPIEIGGGALDMNIRNSRCLTLTETTRAQLDHTPLRDGARRNGGALTTLTPGHTTG
jgi:hypothetical protein